MRLPSFAKARAAARPMPVSAPVIRTTGCFMAILPRPSYGLDGMKDQGFCDASGPDVGLPRLRGKDFVRSGPYLTGMAISYGVAAPALFHCCRRGGQRHACGLAPA